MKACVAHTEDIAHVSGGPERNIRLNTFASTSFLFLQLTMRVMERKRLKKTWIMRMWRVRRK